MSRLISDQVRELTPAQKEAALLCLAFRVSADDWSRAMELAAQVAPRAKVPAS